MIIIHDSTGILSGALRTVFVGRDAWCDGKSIDLDRIRRFVATLPGNCDFGWNLELPAILPFDARLAKPDAIKAAVETSINILRVSRAERPDVGFAWYDAMIEDWTANTNYYESLYRAASRPGLKDDEWFVNMLPEHAAALKRVEWANDQLADIHAESQFICARCYFALGATDRQRSQIIEWTQREGDRIAGGKPVQILYKPNTQNGDKKKSLTDAEIAADVAAMKRSRVRRLCLWRDNDISVARIKAVQAALKVEMQD